MKSILRNCLLGLAVVSVSSQAVSADLYQARTLTQEAVNEATQITAGGGGQLWVSQNNLNQVTYLINDLSPTPAVQSLNQYLRDALRALSSSANEYDKARVVQNNGNEMIRLMDVLIRDGRGGGDNPRDPGYPHDPRDPGYPHDPGYPGGPGYGRIQDTLQMLDQVDSAVRYRDYIGATRLVQDIQNILATYRQDLYLRSAMDSLSRLAAIVNDRYVDEYTRQSRARSESLDARRNIQMSDAYRGGGYNPPRPRPRPPGGELIRENVTCSSFSRGRAVCQASGWIHSAQVLRQYSNTTCVQNVNWGITGDSIWVDNGCRADFSVLIRR